MLWWQATCAEKKKLIRFVLEAEFAAPKYASLSSQVSSKTTSLCTHLFLFWVISRKILRAQEEPATYFARHISILEQICSAQINR